MLRIQQWTAVLALGIVMTLMGCKADQNSFATPNASIGTGDGSGTVDPTAGFKLTLKAKAGVSALLHKFGDYAAACEIAKDTVAPTGINCLLNMMEYDLFFYGFDIQMSVPAGVCSFVEESPYQYFRHEPGTGPTTMSVIVKDGDIQSCLIDGVAGAVNASNLCVSGEVTIGSTGTRKCLYDYSEDKVGGIPMPNCCYGNGLLNVETTVEGAGGVDVTTSVSTKVDWGGNDGSCTDSPNRYIDGWPLSKDKSPMTRVYELGAAALSTTTKYPSILKLNSAGTRPAGYAVFLLANMFDWPTYQANPNTWSMATARVPRAFNVVKDRGAVDPVDRTTNGATFSTPNFGQYKYRCIGPAGEVKHSINLWVQSWNTKEEYDAYVASGDYAAADPYVQGTAGVDCSAVSSSSTCNNFWSFDDLSISEADYQAYEFPNELSRSSP